MTPQKLKITTPHTLADMDRHLYIIQVKHDDGVWSDYKFGNGCNPEKKARHIRNKTGHDTRVIEITEHTMHTYEYSIGKSFEADNGNEQK